MKIKSLILLATSVVVLSSCQESLADKAEREAKEFTRKYCPTPVQNYTRTDSVVFSKTREVYTYYITFVDKMDDKVLINEHKGEIQKLLTDAIRESTTMKTYIEAGYHFEYVCHSEKNPKEVILTMKIQ